jgi:glutathione-regulated potassium-efflux system ancillary protein KefG
MPRKVLILLAHPALERSRINRRMLAAAEGIEGVSVRDLYELYPDLEIDVRREQAALVEHQAIVFQHPFYWYSVPPMLKQWQDLVLEHGWAYGAHGHHLAGKLTLNALSAGGPESTYLPSGFNRMTVRQLLAPWELTANLCRMRFLAPFVVHGAHQLAKPEDLEPYVEDYRKLLLALRDETLDVDRAAKEQRINTDLSALIRSEVKA